MRADNAEQPPAGLLDVLTARSGGVPLFVGALVGSFVDSGALYRYDGRWALAAQPPEAVPAAVSALLQSQVHRLPDEARQVLEALAVCGARVDHALLERLMPGERLLCGLADLRAAGHIVEEVVDGRIRYRAAHALLCEVAYNLLPLVLRRRRHAEVARAVEQYAPQQPALLVQHVRRAGDEIDPDHALGVLLAAADQALARRAGDQALADVRAALDLADALARRELVPGLLDCLADAYELAGDREQAVSAWLAASAQREKGSGRAERLHRAAALELEAGRGEQCRHYLERADAELVDVEPTAAHLSLALTRLRMAYRSGSSAEVETAAAEVARLEDPMGSPRVRAAVLMGRFHLSLGAGRYVEGRAGLPALLALAAEVGDAFGEQARRPGVVLELGWGANEAFLWAVEQNIGPHALATDHGEPDAAATDATVLSGIPVSAGSYTGPARIIRSESEFHRLRPGDVLVCPVTSPVWSVLFPSIGALVTDIGGMLSHPAIIAREYRLPAVVATGDATSRLTDGQIVTVDGTAGMVRIVR